MKSQDLFEENIRGLAVRLAHLMNEAVQAGYDPDVQIVRLHSLKRPLLFKTKTEVKARKP